MNSIRQWKKRKLEKKKRIIVNETKLAIHVELRAKLDELEVPVQWPSTNTDVQESVTYFAMPFGSCHYLQENKSLNICMQATSEEK